MKTIFKRYLTWLPACLLLTGLFVFSDHAACDVKANDNPTLMEISIDAPAKAVKGMSYDICFNFTFSSEVSQSEDIVRNCQYDIDPGTFKSVNPEYSYNDKTFTVKNHITIPSDTTSTSFIAKARFAENEWITKKTVPIYDKVTVNITFKVKNGSWNDGTKADKTKNLWRYEYEDKALVLEAKDIPGAGDMPDAGYKAGAWDVEPPTGVTFGNESKNLTYTYIYSEDPTYKYNVSVKSDPTEGGKVTASKTSGKTGDEVSIKAEEAEDYKFKAWEVIKGGVSLGSLTSRETKFKIQNSDVEITAHFDEDPPVPEVYNVTVTNDGHGNAKATPTSGVSDTKVTITADPKAGYKFSKWKVVSGGVKLANANKAKTTFKIKNANVKVKAIFEKIYKEPQPKLEPVGDDGIILAWWKVKEAKGYDIYMSRCNHGGKEITPKKIKTIKGNKAHQWTVTGLEPNKSYKAYIRAYTTDKNGKKKYISKSPLMHVYTAGGTDTYTDAKSVKLDTSDGKIKKGNKLSLNVKGTYKIKASVKKSDKNRKLMPDSHVKKLRYRSSDPGIATVSASGKITAKKPGKCSIYVYAHNGVNKTINLTVR